MTVIYRERMYHFSRYTNKIDRIYLQDDSIKLDQLTWIFLYLKNAIYITFHHLHFLGGYYYHFLG